MSDDIILEEAKAEVESLVLFVSDLPLPEQVIELRKASRLNRVTANILDVMIENKKQELSVRKLH